MQTQLRRSASNSTKVRVRAVGIASALSIIVLGVTSCSSLPSLTPPALESPVLTVKPLAELLVNGDDLVERLGGDWSEISALFYLPAATELYAELEGSRGSLDPAFKVCNDAFIPAMLVLYKYTEAAGVGFRDGDDDIYVKMYRMSGPDSATNAVAGLSRGLATCAEEAQSNPLFSVTDEETSLDNAAFQHFGNLSDGSERKVFISAGSLVIESSSVKSVELADELARSQLGKLVDIVAASE